MSYWVRIEPARRGVRFSSVEIYQILVAMGALTLAFTLSQVGGIAGIAYFLNNPGALFDLGLFALASFLAVLTAFLFHELAHKVVAQRYGCFAEFRYYPIGLAIGLLTGAFGFVFAAPGAVMISGPVSARQNVRISAAGPGTNLTFAAAFIALAFGLGTAHATADFVPLLAGSVAFVNLFLGLFNLFPFPPLDGSKIFAFNKPLWVAMIVVVGVLFATGSLLQAF